MIKNKPLSRRDVIFLGASGHAKVVIDALEKQDLHRVVGFLDDNVSLKGQYIYNYKVLGVREAGLIPQGTQCFVAIGHNQTRYDVVDWLRQNKIPIIETIIHPSSQLARGVSIGKGSVLMGGSIVNSDAVIGENTIINTGATIDHDCSIGDFVHIAPGVTVCGGVSVGDLTLIGAGAVIHPNINIGKNVIVGAGATVLCDVADGLSVVGTPAEPKI